MADAFTPERIAQLRAKIAAFGPTWPKLSGHGNLHTMACIDLPAALDEIERLSAAQERYRQEALASHAAHDALRAELSRLKAELDEAVKALDEISRKYSNGASANTLAWIARSLLSRMEGR